MNMPFDLLLGRKTFELWAQFWPQHNDIWPAVNTRDQVRRSNTLTSHEWQPSVFPKRRYCGKNHQNQATGRPDLHGLEAQISFRRSSSIDLVDAFWLMIIPVTLGGEKRLFAEGTITAAFKVTESTVTSKGVIIVHYERAGAIPQQEVY